MLRSYAPPKEEGLSDDTGDADAESVSSQASVDTDVDTGASEAEAEPGKDIVESDDQAATGADEAATGAEQAQSAATGALRKGPLWTDHYVYIPDNAGQPDVRIRMHGARLI